MAKGELSGVQKAAILLICLGPERSSAIFKNLKEDEIESLTLEIASTRSVTSEVKESILEEFYQVCLAQQYISEGGISYARTLLEAALGMERAQEVIAKLTVSLQVRPFEFMRKTDSTQLLSFIQDEHPQTIAVILAYLPIQLAAEMIGALPHEKQADVAKRIAEMDRTSPDVIHEVEKVLEKKFESLANQDYTIVGGVDSIVDILNSVDRSTSKRIMNNLEVDNIELADEIKKKMFLFEDIVKLDDKSIQRVLREVDNNEIALALKGVKEDVAEAVFRNLSSRLAEMIREDIEYMGPVKMKDVEEAQQNVVNKVRELEERGEIVIARAGGEEVIV
ncbi:MAG: flagellar motor switch protein FliG [Lachnospiraceae bacterium]|nr:flagellar motor switch protein FliG [Lachnospiraceae bacterium]